MNTVLQMSNILKWTEQRTKILTKSIETLKALINAGIRMQDMKTTMISYYLNERHQLMAIKMANQSDAFTDPFIIQSALVDFIRHKFDQKYFLSIRPV